MRDSIGGTMLFWIVLLLLSIFIVFIAFIIKYARVYKIKNTAVSFLERNEGVSTQEEFENVLLYAGYPRNGGYKICRYLSSDKKGGYYTVELYSITSFPLVGDIMAFRIPIKGETKFISTGTKIITTDDSNNSWFLSTLSECKDCNIESRSCTTTDV